MADPQNPSASGQTRPAGPYFGNTNQPTFSSGVFNPASGPPTSMMMKGPMNNGPLPASSQSQFMPRPNAPGVNGFTNSGAPQQRPPQPFVNGPTQGPSLSTAQPGMPPQPGQIRPPGPLPSGHVGGPRPPFSSAGMSNIAIGTSHVSGMPSPSQHRPPLSSSTSSAFTSAVATSASAGPSSGPQGPVPSSSTVSGPPSMFQPPAISQPASSENQPYNPFSVPPYGPPSQRSSRTSSPVVQQNLDALEGQFKNTPDQEKPPMPLGSGVKPPGPEPQYKPPTWPVQSTAMSAVRPPAPASSLSQSTQSGLPTSASAPRPTLPPASSSQRPAFPATPLSSSGLLGPTSKPGFPPSSLSGAGAQPGYPSQPQPGLWQHNAMLASTQPAGIQGPTSSVSQPSAFAPPSSSVGQVNMMRPPGVRYPMPQGTTSQTQGFPQAPLMSNQMPGFQPPPSSNMTGFPPQPTTPSQRPGFPPPPTSFSQRPGFPPQPALLNQQPGFSSQPASANQIPGFSPLTSTASQQPGFPPKLQTANQIPGFPPPPSSSANPMQGIPPSTSQQPGFPPPPGSSQQSRLPPPPTVNQQPGMFTPGNQQPGFPPSQGSFPQPGATHSGPSHPSRPMPSQSQSAQGIQQFVNSYPKPQQPVNSMTSGMENMSLQGGSINLLQQKQLIGPEGVETPKPFIPNDYKNVNCSPEVFRCTLNSMPQTSGLLNKARLPLGILIHPFKDLSQLPVIQSSVIVRCRSCRTYINPFVYFVDSRRWKCNLCYRVNELPDEFSFDPVTKTYGDPQRRPEVRSATIEFIAPSEYMLRPPQPAVYLYLLDVSFNAIETGYLEMFCETLSDVLDRIPGDSRTQIGFIAYDSCVHFFNLDSGLSQPQMLTVSDVDDIFLPLPDNLLCNLSESRSLVEDLLSQLPNMFKGNLETGSALGAALQAAYKLTHSTGGRVTVMQTLLPTVGPGALQNREDASVKAAKDVPNLGPATDFYKKLALDCSAQQIGVDLFMFNAQYADMASIECISRFSAGSVYYYPSYHTVRAPHLVDQFESDLRRYLTRKIGFESVMRIRCSKGISIHTFHGNFFVRSTDLLSLPNVSPDVGFGMQMSIEEALTDMSSVCFQAALLYTSSKGERRIRVHTLCVPVTNQLSEVHANADQEAIIALLAKMAVDRSLSSSMSDAREAIVNAAIDCLSAYSSSMPSYKGMGGLFINEQLRLVPLYCLALLKSTAFRSGVSTKLDDRTFALQQCKTLPTGQLMQLLYPHLYPLHTIMEVEMVKKNGNEVAKLPLLQLSSANIDRFGAYLLDIGDTMYLYIGSSINPSFCTDMLDTPNYASVEEGPLSELPELDNEGSERLRGFISYLQENRSNGVSLHVVKEDGRGRLQFFHHFVEDRTESTMSYHEFLQHIQKQVKS